MNDHNYRINNRKHLLQTLIMWKVYNLDNVVNLLWKTSGKSIGRVVPLKMVVKTVFYYCTFVLYFIQKLNSLTLANSGKSFSGTKAIPFIFVSLRIVFSSEKLQRIAISWKFGIDMKTWLHEGLAKCPSTTHQKNNKTAFAVQKCLKKVDVDGSETWNKIF